MPMLELSEEELRNLSTFLLRTQLAGQEVPAFIPIMAKINAALSPGEETKED